MAISEVTWKIPTIEEIYNEFHRQRFYQQNGIYPRTIKNFKALEDQQKREYLLRFQNMIRRNKNLINWKMYILAIAEVTQGNFDMSYLGTLKGTKIYRGYIRIASEERIRWSGNVKQNT